MYLKRTCHRHMAFHSIKRQHIFVKKEVGGNQVESNFYPFEKNVQKHIKICLLCYSSCEEGWKLKILWRL
jgi:hypothetical protein